MKIRLQYIHLRPLYLLAFILFLIPTALFSQEDVILKNIGVTTKVQDRIDYINKYKDMAVSQMKKYKIPASITLAQGCLESNNGKSTLATIGNNHFGIKCHDDWKGDTMLHDDDAPQECFRKYADASESFEDHSKYLCSKRRYASLFSLDIKDYAGWAKGLKACGYATNPSYANELIQIIEDYDLTRFDSGNSDEITVADMTQEEMQSAETEQTQEGILKDAVPMQVSPLYSFSMDRQIYSDNGRPYVVSTEGDTYEGIAKEYHLFNREIYSYNNADKDAKLNAGTLVYLDKMRSKYKKEDK